jgi:undecaprenyl-diphosphatase
MAVIEQIVLGILQGIFEWLPISSEGAIFLVSSYFFNNTDVSLLLRQALFLHLGTFFAALIYLRKEVSEILRGLFNYKKQSIEIKKTINFLVISTIISGIIGLIFLKLIDDNASYLLATTKIIILFISVLLIITALLQIYAKHSGVRRYGDLNSKDGVLLGIMQGLSALPGLSRSGLTVSSLLLRKVDKKSALKLSFLMSLPIILGANIFLGLSSMVFYPEMLIGLLFSFVFGLLTIHLFIKLAEKINFGYFLFLFAILMLLSLLFI